jgi:CheY-like chemotaxis protein
MQSRPAEPLEARDDHAILPLAITKHAAKPRRVHPTTGESHEIVPIPRLDGLRALIVDDESDAGELTKRVLQDQGANVRVAASGPEALEMLQLDSADVLISDIGMPDMDGYQLMRRLRAVEPKGSRIPALAVTAFARPDDRKQAILAGYHAHLAKPFDMAEFVIVIAGPGRANLGSVPPAFNGPFVLPLGELKP